MKVAEFVEENDDEQITISDLIIKMEVILDGSEYSAYSRVHICSKLKEHFGDRLVITYQWKVQCRYIQKYCCGYLQDFYNSQQKPDLSSEKIRFIQTASKLIMSDIKLLETKIIVILAMMTLSHKINVYHSCLKP